MKEFKVLGILIIFVFIAFSFAFSQDDSQKDISNYSKKLYYLDPLVFYKKDTAIARLDLYIEIPYRNLQFKKNQANNTLEATVDYTIVIINSRKDAVVNKSFTELIKITREEQKNSSEGSDYIIKQFYLPPDNYTLSFMFKDRVTFDESSMDINFDLEITPDAEVQLIFDSKAGDVMKGTGSGNLNISLNPKGEFKMYGDYIIEDGDYLFTLGSLLNKRFIVQSGGKISFNGKMEDAEVDIRAVYKTKAPLSDIMPDQPDPKLKERIPVECQLNLTGNLFKPVVGFDIYLPTADEETRAYLRSMIKSDEEMSRQFLFLLVMNSFYADPGTRSATQSTSDIGTATVGVTTTEMLSNQLSNWLSQISNDFDIGINYRPGSTALPNSQEVQVALSTQILNDKVVINGNFDYGTNQTSTSTPASNNAITGAFDVEVKITDKIRFKVFNRSNDNFYIDNGIQYTQGVGLFFKQDFNKFRDLFTRSGKNTLKSINDTVPSK